MNRLTLTLALTILVCGARAARAQSADIPTAGLELWLKADGPMKVSNGQVTEWTDASGKGNNAIHDAFGSSIPNVAMANGKPTLKFSGAYTGFHFAQIANIRSIFAVLSKDSASCLPTLPNYGTPAKFWIGGSESKTYFHPEHGCSIWNGNLSEVSPDLVNGKTYVNGKLVDGRKTYFPVELGLVSAVATANVVADTIARDRTFQDRSWQGNISELLLYSEPLDDDMRVSIQNALMSKYAIGMAGGAGGQGGNTGAGGGGMGGTTIGGGGASTGGNDGGGATSKAGATNGGAAAGGSASGSAQGGSVSSAGSGGSGATEAVGGTRDRGTAGADLGSPPDASSGCSCSAAGSRTPGGSVLALLLGISCLIKRNRARA